MEKHITKRILLIENNQIYLELIENSLKQAGFKIKNAETASEGLRYMDDFKPHVILLNEDLPDLSGKDLIVALRSNGYENPIIVISDDLLTSEAIQYYRLSASDFIIPPYREAEIINIVERVLTQSSYLEEHQTQTLHLNQNINALKKNINDLSIVLAIQKTFELLSNECKIVEFMYRALSRYFNTSTSYIVSIDEKQKFSLQFSIGLEVFSTNTPNQEWHDLFTNYLFLAKEPLIINNNENLKKYKLDNIGKTALGYPLVINEQLKAIFVFIRKNGENFNNEDLRFINLIADQAISNINNLTVKKKLKQRTQDKKYLEKRLNLLIQENQKTHHRLTNAIEPHLAQNQISLFELKSNPHIDNERIDSLLDNLLEIEKNIKLSKLNFEYLNNLSLQEVCLNNLLEELIAPYGQENVLFVYAEEHNLYIADKEGTIELVIAELLEISLKHKAHKPIVVKLETTKNNFAKVSFLNPNKIIDYEAMLMLFNPLYEKEVLPLPSESEIEERQKTSTLKQIIYLNQGLIWAEKTLAQGNSIHLTIPLSVDSFSK